MKIRKKLVLLVGCILGYLSAFSQENYVDGYIVDLEGDTIQGEIDYQNWNLNPDRIYFKKQGQSSATKYTPLSISSFSAAGEFYYSGIVQAEKGSQNTMNITKDRSFSFATDTTFLQALVVGEKSLFHYTDKASRTNFYISTESGFELLKFKLYLISRDGRLLKHRNKTYISQLSNYFGSCEEVEESLLDVEYTKKSLLKIFNAYYKKCKEQNAFYAHELPRAKLATRILGGISFTDLSYTRFARSTAPTAGLGLDIIFPRNFEKWSLNNDLLFTRYVAEDSYHDIYNGRENSYEYEIKLLSFKLSHMVRYTHPGEGGRFFLNFGLIHGYSLVSKNYQKKVSTFGPKSYEEVGKALPLNNEVLLGYLAGIGAVYHKFLVEVRFEKTRGLLGTFDSKAVYVLVGYRLNNFSSKF